MVNFELLRQDGRSGYIFRILLLLIIPMEQSIYFIINNTTKNAHDVTIFLDNLIPFNEWFVIPYVFWYIYLFGIFLVLAYFDHKTYYKLLFSIFFGALICFVIYCIYPSTVPRPEEALGNDNILKRIILIIYGNDKPYNCLPSIHVLDTFLVTLYLFKHYKSLMIKIASGLIYISICLSTFYIKQHSVLDAIAAMILGTILFLTFESEFVYKKAESFWAFITQRKSPQTLKGDT